MASLFMSSMIRSAGRRARHVAVMAVIAVSSAAAPADAQQVTRAKVERYAYLTGLMAGAAIKCGVPRARASRFIRMRGYVVGRLAQILRRQGQQVTRASFSDHFKRGTNTAQGRTFDCSKARPGFARAYASVEKIAGRHVPQ